MHLNMVFQNINHNSSYYLAGTEGRSLPLLNLITWKMAKDKFGFIFTIDPLDKDASNHTLQFLKDFKCIKANP